MSLPPAASTSILPPDYPPTILSLAHSLSTSLNSTFAPAIISSTTSRSSHLLHSLGPIDPTSFSTTRQHVTSTLSSLRTAVDSFNSLLPAPTPLDAPPTRPPHAQIDKYLTVLKEASMQEGALSNWSASEFDTSKRLVQHFTDQASLLLVHHHPDTTQPPANALERIVGILETMTKKLGLVSFRDAESSAGGDRTETLSLGGKVMVVDVEIDRTKGAVEKVKVSYVMEQGQVELDEAAKRIERCLQGLAPSGKEEQEKEVQVGLKRCRNVLRELARLDTMTEESGIDAFKAIETMVEGLKKVLEGESSGSFETRGHGHLVPRTHDHLPRIIYHVTPLAQVSDAWSETESNGFILPDQALALEGVSSLRIELEKVSKSTVLPSSYVDLVAEEVENLASFDLLHNKTGLRPRFATVDRTTAPTFVARFEKGVPVSKEVGRRIAEVLERKGNGLRLEKVEVAAAREGAATLEDLLVSTDASINLKPIDPEARYRITFDDVSLAQEYGLATTFSSAGYLVTDVRFQSLAELFRVIEILQEQERLNGLARSVINSRHLVKRPMSSGGKSILPSPTKRRRLEVEPMISLEQLLAPSSRTSVPIFVHLHPSSSLSLSFPSPSGSAELAKPLAIHVSSTSSGLKVKLEGTELIDRLDVAKTEKILETGGDLSLLMRWVIKSLTLESL